MSEILPDHPAQAGPTNDVVEQASDPASAAAPEKTQHEQGIGVEFQESIASLKEDLPSTAIQVLQDKFRSTGIGPLGTVFRSMQYKAGSQGEEELWSDLLDLVTKLWESEFHEAALKLLKDGRLRLSPPKVFEDTFTESIAYGEDHLIYLRANRRFLEGDVEGARGLLKEMSKDVRGPMEKQLKEKSKERQRSRKVAFLTAGIAGALCLAASSVSFYVLRDLVHNPYTMKVPEFNFPTMTPPSSVTPITPTNVDSQAVRQGSGDDLDNPKYPDKVDVIEDNASIDSIFGETKPASKIRSNINHGTHSVDAMPEFSERDTNTKVSKISTEDLSRCGLAFRISADVAQIAAETRLPQHVAKMKDFQQAFLSACSSIPAKDIQESAKDFEDRQVNGYARGVLGIE